MTAACTLYTAKTTTVLSGAEERVAEERPGWNFQIFLGTCQARKLKIITVWIIVRKICTLYCIEGHHFLHR